MSDVADAQQERKLREQYPMLEVRGEGPRKISGVALASKNIKRLLRREFPGVKFSTRCDIYSGGCAVYVSWLQFQGEPDIRSRVNELLYPFEYGRFDGMTDSSSTDEDPYRRAFRSLFGGSQSVIAQPAPVSLQEQAAHTAAMLQTRTKAAPPARKPKAPGRF